MISWQIALLLKTISNPSGQRFKSSTRFLWKWFFFLPRDQFWKKNVDNNRPLLVSTPCSWRRDKCRFCIGKWWKWWPKPQVDDYAEAVVATSWKFKVQRTLKEISSARLAVVCVEAHNQLVRCRRPRQNSFVACIIEIHWIFNEASPTSTRVKLLASLWGSWHSAEYHTSREQIPIQSIKRQTLL